MSYQVVNSRAGEFAVDWDIVSRLSYSYWLSYYRYEYATEVLTSESSWYNPFSWSMPNTVNVDVPWEKVRDAATLACNKDMFLYGSRASGNMPEIARDLEAKVKTTAINKRGFAEWLRDVQRHNAGELESADSQYSNCVLAARFIRDASADVVTVGSTIATGGAAWVLLGGSSVAKGAAKYQDTGSAGAAMLYGSGSLLLGVFKIDGKKVSKGAEWALIVVQGSLETATSFVAGDGFGKAIEKGALKVATAGGTHAVFSRELVKNLFKNLALPFKVIAKTRDGDQVVIKDVANRLTEGVSKKLLERASKEGASALLGAMRGSGGTRPSLVYETPLDDLLLLKLAVVNMKKGIGHGW